MREQKGAETGPMGGFDIAEPLLCWYSQNRRILPFREDATPYHVWVSEVMLQQTQMKTALPYYERFIVALPDVAALAAAGEDELHRLWQGLGYYSRARNLQKAARVVIQKYGGVLPASYEALLGLPGIGPYTAGAIASIAFGLPRVAVDGNVLRVFARLLNCGADITLPATQKALAAQVRLCQPMADFGGYNQALMELGALVCVPGAPKCGVCPLAMRCLGRMHGQARTLPRRAPKKAKQRQDVCVLAVHSAGRVLLQRRAAKGLLAGLWQPLLFEETLTENAAAQRLGALLPGARLASPLPVATHVFTHRIWRLYGWQCAAPAGSPAPEGMVFADAVDFGAYALPSAFKAYFPFLGG